MESEISIRALTPDDWQDFSATRLEALQKYPQFFGSTYAYESAYGKEDWQEWLGYKDGCVFGLYCGNELVGITGVRPLKDDLTGSTCFFIASYIKPEHQGKGLSSKLYRARIDWALANPKWKKIVVGHRDGNEPSRQANQKWGFVYTHRQSKTWPDGTSGDDLYYELDLEQLRQKL